MKVVESSNIRLVMELDSSLYTDPVIHKCFYWYGDEFSVDIERMKDGKGILVSLEIQKDSDPVDDWQTVKDKIRRDLLDYTAREIVNKETRTIRELIVAKAFAMFDEPSPLTSEEISDPVGFSVEDFDEPS